MPPAQVDTLFEQLLDSLKASTEAVVGFDARESALEKSVDGLKASIDEMRAAVTVLKASIEVRNTIEQGKADTIKGVFSFLSGAPAEMLFRLLITLMLGGDIAYRVFGEAVDANQSGAQEIGPDDVTPH